MIKWEGLPESESTWEPSSSVHDHLITKYEQYQDEENQENQDVNTSNTKAQKVTRKSKKVIEEEDIILDSDDEEIAPRKKIGSRASRSTRTKAMTAVEIDDLLSD